MLRDRNLVDDLCQDWDFWELWWPQIFRGVGLMFAIIPINNIALGTLPPDSIKNASGLYNLMRNLGGAVGLAAIYTFLNNRSDLHFARLHEALNSAYRPALQAGMSSPPKTRRFIPICNASLRNA
jgi:DHA2 family multidrug resistance protein